MTRLWGTYQLLFAFLVALGGSTLVYKDTNKVLRELRNVSSSSGNMKQCLWFAMQEYNKYSKDKFLFQVVKVQQVQMQVTDRLEYFIDAEISRTNCRKLPNGNENCVVKNTSKLEKRQMCTFWVGALPWHGYFTVMKKQCVDA
ncbi:cystatin-8 [Moschus berezovskii]|uniref:cystatin-8 n=1 Tax=Moschus berezovskii TaxID=68408 RepID=UPI0024442EB2|nr:cystatin-8 [Moschus berezovskii]